MLSNLNLERLSKFFFLGAAFFLPFSIAILEICLTLSFICWLLHKFRTGESLHQNRRVFVILGLFLISSSVSAFYSGYPITSAQGIVKLLKYSLIMLVAADLFSDFASLKRLLIVCLVSFTILLIDCMVQNVYGKDLINGFSIHFTDEQVRLTGPYKSYGLLAAHLIAVPPLVLSLLLNFKYIGARRWYSFALLFVFLVGLYILYRTHSRGAWLAYFGALLFYAFMLRSRMMFLILIIALFIAPFVMPRNALIHLDFYKREQSVFERYRLWERALQVIAKEPLFGCGINTYARNYQKYDQVKNWRVPGYYAHNGYLQLAAETGLIALFLFLFLIWEGVRMARLTIQKTAGRTKLLLIGLLTGFISLLLQVSVDTILHNVQTAALIWLFLGLLYAVGNLKSVQTKKAA